MDGDVKETGEVVLSVRVSTPLINRAHVKRFALDYCARSQRVHVRKNMKRVSGEFMTALDSAVREWIRKRVDSQASVGMTLR
jgi:hypothetical protein